MLTSVIERGCFDQRSQRVSLVADANGTRQGY